jgi:alkylated DNA repair dioxygenase AlkB
MTTVATQQPDNQTQETEHQTQERDISKAWDGCICINDLLSSVVANECIDAILKQNGEVHFDQYFADAGDHLVPLPRLIGFQADQFENGTTPWYRCTMAAVPTNAQKMKYGPWTDTISAIKKAAEDVSGQKWNMAHIIFYQGKESHMGFHSDTPLDMIPGSTIGIVSLGASRTMRFYSKNKAANEQADFQMNHNSLFIMDDRANVECVHGILRNNNRAPRIAIVFRNILMKKRTNGSFYSDEYGEETFDHGRLVELCNRKNTEVMNHRTMREFLHSK